MNAILTRGGFTHSISKDIYSLSFEKFKIITTAVKTLSYKDIQPYRTEFTNKTRVIIENISKKNKTSYYLQGAGPTIDHNAKYLTAIAAASTKQNVNTTALIGWISVSVARIIWTIIISLYIFAKMESKRYQKQNNQRCLIS